MSKKEIFSAKSFKTLKNLKLDDNSNTDLKYKKQIPSTEEFFNKRR
jgi:hypothetical protein